MGCFSSSEAKYQEGASGSDAKKSQPKSGKDKASSPDFGLGGTHEIVKLLGRGGEGETWLVKDKASGHEMAAKLICRPIPKAALAVIKREIKIQSDLGAGHLNLVSADEVILTKSHLGLIMEYVPAGNMVQYVTKQRETKSQRGGLCMDEDEARFYFLQLLSAVDYCHKHQVAHRDLKLDNTLLTGHEPHRIKLCDFGFAKHWMQTSNMNTMRIGTPEYMGPELISSRTGYDGVKVDVWAAGVLLYVMLVGVFPFETQDDNFSNTAGLYDIWLQQIKTTWRDAPNNSSAASRLSAELKDLLDKMFEVKQDARIDVAGIRIHPWTCKPLPEPYVGALKQLRSEQETIDKALAAGHYKNPDADKLLEVVLEKASAKAMPTEEIVRVPLSRPMDQGAADTSVIPSGMATLAE